MNPPRTPEDVLAFFADEAARVTDEVARIADLLTEREPCSNRPKHIDRGRMVLNIEDNDEPFMQKVADAFEQMGFKSMVSTTSLFGESKKVFVLTHESFSTLPGQASRSGSAKLPAGW